MRALKTYIPQGTPVLHGRQVPVCQELHKQTNKQTNKQTTKPTNKLTLFAKRFFKGDVQHWGFGSLILNSLMHCLT
jgi:hypothetical protein